MAKRIKTVQCPQCGSAQQTKIENDHYRCQSCGAEYFIDNDDINVNVKHQYGTTSPRSSEKNSIWAIIGTVVSMLFVFSIMIYTAIGGGEKSTSSSPLSTGTIATPINNDIKGAVLPVKSGKDISFLIYNRTYGKWNDADSRNGYYAAFFDLTKKEIIKESKIEIPVARSSIDEYKFRHFKSMDKTYIILNKTKIYDIDFEQMTVKDVTVEMFNGFDDYQAGLSVIEFTYRDRGDGFKVVTNLGKNLYFYPSVKKSYTEDEAYKNGDGWKALEPSANEQTFYMFTNRSRDYPEKLIQLLEVTYMNNGGGPEDQLNYISWSKDYSSNVRGYIPSLINKYQLERSRVKKWCDFTPERVYFDATVLYHREKENDILISYKPTLAPDAPRIFQLIDLETKDPKWTIQTSEEIYFTDVSLTDKHFVVLKHSRTYYFLPIEGGEMTSYELPHR